MGKTAIRKDFRVEIKRTFSRFLSIFCIVALGVAFFSGIRAAEPDMRLSYDEYFDKYQLADITIMGTMGLTAEDVTALKTMDEVEKVQTGRSADFLCNQDGNEMVVQVISEMKDLNCSSLTKGKWPSKNNECVMDDSLAGKKGYKVGDVIQLSQGEKKEKVTNTLTGNEFTITGLVSSPLYITFGRGTTTLGQGEIDGFIGVGENAFVTDYYTRLDISLKGAKEKTAFTQEYNDFVDSAKDKIETELSDKRCDLRYQSLKGDILKELDEGQKKVEDAGIALKEKLGKAKNKLNNSKKELQQASEKLGSKEQQLSEGKQQLSVQKGKLEDTKKQLLDSEKEITRGQRKLAQGWKQYKEGKKQYDRLNKQLEEAMMNPDYVPEEKLVQQLKTQKEMLGKTKENLEKQQTALTLNRTKVQSGLKQVTAGLEEISQKEKELDKNQKLLAQGRETLLKNQKKIKEGYQEYQEEKKQGELKLAEEQKKLDEGRKELSAVKFPKWYVLTREENPGYTECGQNADRIAAIGKVFPIIFFLVAALISLTTMTRMVDEQRVLIGTYKALGYSKFSIAGKYVWYALLATLGGCVAGILIGEKIIPAIIIKAYQIMYVHIPNCVIPYQWSYGMFAILASLACTIGATTLACYRELAAVPAALMRPRPPVKGKRILLERITFLWKRISFSEKATLRNLFRYKKRFLMTLLGISGCMALIVVGFGLQDAITDINDIQFQELQTYDAMVLTSADEKDAAQTVGSALSAYSEVKQYTNIFFNAASVSGNQYTTEAYLFVPEEVSKLDDFVDLRERSPKRDIQIKDSGAVISEKLGKLLEVKEGDRIVVTYGEKKASVRVEAITEMYLKHYIYMTPTLFRKMFGEEPDTSTIIYNGKKEGDYKKTGEKLLTMEQVQNVTYVESSREQLEYLLGSLDLVIVVLIVSAGLLAFVVLYNLNNINIEERKRELASIKVLGFYNGELAAYVYRENILLTFIGMAFGLLFGKYLLRFVVVTVEIENCMFSRNVHITSYLISLGITLLFSVLVNAAMYMKIKKIDMIASLKSVE